MASTPMSALPNTVTRDALFLFELFRESPKPILIHIGPYANKTGAKPNTIIKRIAGIKQRNGLNISTTLGDYVRPSPSADDNGETKAKVPREKKIPKSMKAKAELVKLEMIPVEQYPGENPREGQSPASLSYSASSESINSVSTPTSTSTVVLPSEHVVLKRRIDETEDGRDELRDIVIKRSKGDLE